MKKHLLTLSLMAFSTVIMAQSGTNSPYSQYGLGLMTDPSQGFNRGMNGVGLGFREHNQVNYINPASYSAIDSLTFILDAGMSLQTTNFSENGKKKNANNADFEYAVALFRIMKHVGVAAGIVPYSNVGYNYSDKTDIKDYYQVPSTSAATTLTNTYYGTGGLHQIFAGIGWEPINGLSIGANINYLWGDIDNFVENTYSDNSIKSLIKYYTANVKSYKLDFGAQYTHVFNKKHAVTAGVTYTPGHKLGTNAECLVLTNNMQSSVNDTTKMVAYDALAIPTQIGVGFAYKYNNQWKAGIDYTLQRWSGVDFPLYGEKNGITVYTTESGIFKDRHTIKFGGEYCQNENGRSFAQRMHYRFGAGYSTPYLNINGKEGPREYSVSAGIAFPIVNAWNNRSILNISVQWANMSSKQMLTENTFRINIGLTFNERWFAKWRFE